MNKEKMKLTKKFWCIVITICFVLLAFVFISIICFVNRKPDIIDIKEEGGNVTLKYTSDTNYLTILNATPLSDTLGMSNLTEGQYFDFSVEVKMLGANYLDYEISIIKDEKSSTIEDDDIRIYLERIVDGTYTKVFGPDKYISSKNYSDIGSELGSMVLVKKKVTTNSKEDYRLRIWLSDEAKISDGSYSVKVDIHALSE